MTDHTHQAGRIDTATIRIENDRGESMTLEMHHTGCEAGPTMVIRTDGWQVDGMSQLSELDGMIRRLMVKFLTMAE